MEWWNGFQWKLIIFFGAFYETKRFKDTIERKRFFKNNRFRKFFDVYKKDDKYYYNLNTSLYLNCDETNLKTYICTHEMHWPLISYNIYGTPRLAWLLLKINKVSTKDVFIKKQPGDEIKYISDDKITNIVEFINN